MDDRTQEIIEAFLSNERQPLTDLPESQPRYSLTDESKPTPDMSRTSQVIDGFLQSESSARRTSSMANECALMERKAQNCIKQQQYSEALEIIRQLNLQFPQKKRYFAVQIKFLEKLITNNKTR